MSVGRFFCFGRKHWFVVFCAVFLFAGCATNTEQKAKLNALVGQNIQQLIDYMGKPSARKILNDGREVWTYTKVDDVYVPSEFYLYNQGAFSNEYGGLYAPFMDQYDFSPYEQGFGYTVQYVCQTSFLIQHQLVIAWKQIGNDCETN